MKISIVGQITDYKADGCFSPLDLKELLEGVSQDEPLEVEITSEGGSVFAGIQIANMLSRHRGFVSTHAVGLCASIATVILMAGKRISVDENCFCLIHLPWSYCEGNSNDMMKEIETLKKCEAAMMGYYRKHCKVDEELLSKYINEETWFLGTEFADVFDCEVIACDNRFDIAAKCDLTKFNKIDKRILDMTKEKKIVEEEEKKEEVIVKPIPTNEDGSAEEKKEPLTDEKIEEPMHEEVKEKHDENAMDMDDVLEKLYEYERMIELLKKENEELKSKLAEMETPKEEEEKVSKEECEKRVSGMQASMQKQINEHLNQLKAKDEEIRTVRAELSSLNSKLEEATKELAEKSSALVEKENALAMLNAGVNAPCEELPTFEEGLAKCHSPSERVAFINSKKYKI